MREGKKERGGEVFEEYFNIPFFRYLFFCTDCLHPPTKIPVPND